MARKNGIIPRLSIGITIVTLLGQLSSLNGARNMAKSFWNIGNFLRGVRHFFKIKF